MAANERATNQARRLLEAAGYEVCRAGGAVAPFDLVAWDTTSIRFISVKVLTEDANPIERESLLFLPRPVNASVEIWRFPDPARPPVIERL